MIVLVPHPAEELKLVNLQKELIKITSQKNQLFYQVHPLWIPLSFINPHEEDIKKIASNITAVKIQELQIQEQEIIATAAIEHKKQIYATSFNLLKKIKKSGTNITTQVLSKEVILSSAKILPIEINIFRIGIAQQNQKENSHFLIESAWAKIKPKPHYHDPVQ